MYVYLAKKYLHMVRMYICVYAYTAQLSRSAPMRLLRRHGEGELCNSEYFKRHAENKKNG